MSQKPMTCSFHRSVPEFHGSEVHPSVSQHEDYQENGHSDDGSRNRPPGSAGHDLADELAQEDKRQAEDHGRLTGLSRNRDQEAGPE